VLADEPNRSNEDAPRADPFVGPSGELDVRGASAAVIRRCRVRAVTLPADEA